LAPGVIASAITVSSSDDSELTVTTDKGLLEKDYYGSTWSNSVAVYSGGRFYFRAPGAGGTCEIKVTTGGKTQKIPVTVTASNTLGLMNDALADTYYNGLVGSYRAASVQLADGRVAQFGGSKGGASSDETAAISIYDPAAPQHLGTATQQTATMAVPRKNFTATLLPNGKILLCGGETTGTATVTASAELYDPATNTIETLPNMATARTLHTATLLPNGKVLIAGGENGTNAADAGSASTSSADLFDPATKTFTATGPLAETRSRHTATLLPDGKVLMVGGWGYADMYTYPTRATAEVYNPATGTFTTVGSLGTARFQHTAALLANGKVLITGGIPARGGDALMSCELFDPASGLFTPGPNLGQARRHHAAIALPDGKILIVGGVGALSLEIYDPTANSFATGTTLDDKINPALPWLAVQGTSTDHPKGRVLLFFPDKLVRSYLP